VENATSSGTEISSAKREPTLCALRRSRSSWRSAALCRVRFRRVTFPRGSSREISMASGGYSDMTGDWIASSKGAVTVTPEDLSSNFSLCDADRCYQWEGRQNRQPEHPAAQILFASLNYCCRGPSWRRSRLSSSSHTIDGFHSLLREISDMPSAQINSRSDQLGSVPSNTASNRR
jgi:hypothetical protein